MPRRRLFTEHWSRVSTGTFGSLDRVEVRLPASHTCANSSARLSKLPGGLEHLRSMLVNLFGSGCSVEQAWALRANFVLIDITLGQALLVGDGAITVVPDASLPALSRPGSNQNAEEALRHGGSHLMQSQRLMRWIRRFPKDHRGLIIATDEPLAKLRKQFIRDNRRVPQTSAVCISQAAVEGGTKYRLTPGTKWCGDGGWSHIEFFDVLRSMTSVPKDRLVPICIAYNPKVYTYRFDLSEDGCFGHHKASGTSWRHAHTIHTSKDARGDRICVGVLTAGALTRWIMKKQEKCNTVGLSHSFSFTAMAADQYSSPFLRGCLLAARQGVVQRLAAGSACTTFGAEWSQVRELVFLATRHSPSDYRICPAEGEGLASTNKKANRLWRAFWNTACEKPKLSIIDFSGHKTDWTIVQDPPIFVPDDASGIYLCLCRIRPATNSSKESDVFSWVEGGCPPQGAEQELCMRDLSVMDILRFANLIDEVT